MFAYINSLFLDGIDSIWAKGRLISFGIVICMFFGLANLYSISDSVGVGFFYKQLLHFFVGIALAIFICGFRPKINMNFAIIIYFLGLFLLIMVLFFGKTSMGAQRWLKVGPVTLQPSEFMKISIIILMSKVSESMKVSELSSLKGSIFMSLIFLLPALIIGIQPDLTTAFIVLLLGSSVIFINGIKARYIFLFGSCILLAMPVIFSSLKDYQKLRVINFLDPYNDPMNTGYNAIQSIIAVGSGGFVGKGPGMGTQARLRFLPESHTDFVFASISEEFGFIGSIAIVFAFICIISNCMYLSFISHEYSRKILSFGCGMYFFLNAFINIAMNIGLFPVAGVPMPFVSYGGSSLLTSLAFCALVISLPKKQF